jgi:hypothetical protein
MNFTQIIGLLLFGYVGLSLFRGRPLGLPANGAPAVPPPPVSPTLPSETYVGPVYTRFGPVGPEMLPE